ncbi:glycosyl hydrolase [Sinomonas sp. R1AF57]|uniref:glycosyl hydrolase n=1 Tax=Sinomonas sp. R1AF57 TaxID=2020377 RepID=UPI000B60BC5E|nr:glycosyl hydrolase [Sinomonas sp. R1AF57]ASN51488.1 hypothetical protein CGQ25_04870 [Sinomonas sp. R1AF57]
MTGIGVDANVHSWHNGALKPAIDRYVHLGPMTWRVIIEKADWEPSQYGSPDVIDEAYYNRIYSAGKMEDLWDTIDYIESFPGQAVSLSIMGGVADWMGGNHIETDKEEYWVRMLASLLDYGSRERHARVELVSPFNEPDWNGIEGPKVDPVQMTRLLDKLGKRLDDLGLGDVRFVVPDTANAEAARSQYMPALLANPSVVAKIARIGIHSYSGDSAGVPQSVHVGPLANAGVWATEFNAWCDACDSGAPPPGAWDQASAMAHDLLAMIDQGVTGAQLYDAWDGYYEHHSSVGYWGALAYDAGSGAYTPRRSFDVLALAVKNIPPGAVRLSTSGAASVDADAFLVPSSGEITVVGINRSSSVQRFRVAVQGTPSKAPTTLSVVDPAVAGVGLSTVSAQGDPFVVSVPAGAMFALGLP